MQPGLGPGAALEGGGSSLQEHGTVLVCKGPVAADVMLENEGWAFSPWPCPSRSQPPLSLLGRKHESPALVVPCA